ncbi:hypothetical protein CEXT_512931 [Caerostris extrusa]|uniref:Uncharacterized protein n=1 Tax=Caerostris extrusa TaxID=172846 RepID=A0AAV4W4X6_CAEEX|nr:hypothetical protein CEXT_512931 [Caerostris extrusa]
MPCGERKTTAVKTARRNAVVRRIPRCGKRTLPIASVTSHVERSRLHKKMTFVAQEINPLAQRGRAASYNVQWLSRSPRARLRFSDNIQQVADSHT